MRRAAIALGLFAFGCETPEHAPERSRPVVVPRVAVAPASTARPPRLAALDVEVFVRERPRASSPEIGVLHIGREVVRSKQPVSRDGCEGGWYSVEPEGFVCHGRLTTLDPDAHPLVRAARAHAADFARAVPYRWFESNGEAPLYRRVPSAAEQRRSEPELERHLRRAKGPLASAEPPAFLRDHTDSPWTSVHTPHDRRPRVRFVPARSTIAATHEFAAGGRSFLLTADLLVVPKDRLVEQVASDFSGVHLDGTRARLPLAFVRGEPRPKFRWVEDDVVPASTAQKRGRFTETGQSWPRLAWMGLTGRELTSRGARYLETSGRDWIRAEDATVVASEPPRGFELEAGEKWIDVSIFRGTLVAYEGTRAVFTTLISPGANGYKRIDGELARFTTPTGTFRLEWKHRTTTMTPDPERRGYTLAEVPFTQFFHMPFALHAAYWHDRFGEPKSGGCVNLSPKDAEWLFAWTAPVVPDAWHGVRSGGKRGPGTWVRIR